ncbi:MAG TPA: phosphoribosylformylglycinamidine synthase I [Phycisphaerae bacterium]|nr:phosphoribosylformylglycinamidine synthase I [Phycisphaerae bacterium]HRW55561.1 phosphoribosylformylglycinamidine synthase I [Phycisphaerae bacterium]
MATIRVLVVRAPGINCEEETAFAWRQAGAEATPVHVRRLIESPEALDAFQIVTIPGGFSYGDDIASGSILANQMRQGLGDALTRFVDRGGLVIGICNGFQVLVRLGLVPGADAPARATLTWNDSGRYEARWVHLRASVSHCPFLREDELYHLPVAHGEGRIAMEDGSAGADRLSAANRIALRYVSAAGSAPIFPENPNGSIENAAGLTDSTGRVLGLMPHPERNIFACNRPAGARGASSEIDGHPVYQGNRLFENAISALR